MLMRLDGIPMRVSEPGKHSPMDTLPEVTEHMRCETNALPQTYAACPPLQQRADARV